MSLIGCVTTAKEQPEKLQPRSYDVEFVEDDIDLEGLPEAGEGEEESDTGELEEK
tara:strand:- start:246 stop:410 length:165 start_codon:yes stop_codon:yes gene_type:complete